MVNTLMASALMELIYKWEDKPYSNNHTNKSIITKYASTARMKGELFLYFLILILHHPSLTPNALVMDLSLLFPLPLLSSPCGHPDLSFSVLIASRPLNTNTRILLFVYVLQWIISSSMAKIAPWTMPDIYTVGA